METLERSDAISDAAFCNDAKRLDLSDPGILRELLPFRRLATPRQPRSGDDFVDDRDRRAGQVLSEVGLSHAQHCVHHREVQVSHRAPIQLDELI
jgi:hypothetical protein